MDPIAVVTILGLYITGPAQVVLHTMSSRNAIHYEWVKEAILGCYEVIEETQTQKNSIA